MERMPVTYRHRPNVTTCKFDGSLARHYADVSLPADAVGIWWLGQAGFALRYGQFSLLIDPYLSDSLARKYAGTELPHTRMMSAPISPAEFDGIDAVLTTMRELGPWDIRITWTAIRWGCWPSIIDDAALSCLAPSVSWPLTVVCRKAARSL